MFTRTILYATVNGQIRVESWKIKQYDTTKKATKSPRHLQPRLNWSIRILPFICIRPYIFYPSFSLLGHITKATPSRTWQQNINYLPVLCVLNRSLSISDIKYPCQPETQETQLIAKSNLLIGGLFKKVNELSKWRWFWILLYGKIKYLVKPTLGPPKKFQHLTRAEEVVITRLRIGHTKATKSHILSRGPPTSCHHCGQTLTIDHMLLECALLEECRDEYHTVDSLNALFETIPETCIVEYLREAGFFYLIWCNLLTSTGPQTWKIWSDLSNRLENESNSETHLPV